MTNTQCKKDSKDKFDRRIHEYVSRKDGEGREFRVCNKCSNMQVTIPTKIRKFNEEI